MCACEFPVLGNKSRMIGVARRPEGKARVMMGGREGQNEKAGGGGGGGPQGCYMKFCKPTVKACSGLSVSNHETAGTPSVCSLSLCFSVFQNMCLR